jgi:hypothetical protein
MMWESMGNLAFHNGDNLSNQLKCKGIKRAFSIPAD